MNKMHLLSGLVLSLGETLDQRNCGRRVKSICAVYHDIEIASDSL